MKQHERQLRLLAFCAYHHTGWHSIMRTNSRDYRADTRAAKALVRKGFLVENEYEQFHFYCWKPNTVEV